jgi:hypothetical protein
MMDFRRASGKRTIHSRRSCEFGAPKRRRSNLRCQKRDPGQRSALRRAVEILLPLFRRGSTSALNQ